MKNGSIRTRHILASALCLVTLSASLGGTSGLVKAEWPSFLGQGRTSHLRADNLPLSWEPQTNLAWKTSLPGKGQSSPVIFDSTVYVTSIEGEMKEHCHVTAIDLRNGKQLWNRSVDASSPIRSNYFQSRSAPTPVVDTLSVVAFFETGNLICLDRETGSVRWERSLTKEYGEFQSTIGLATSPIQDSANVYLMIDHEGDSYLLCIAKKSGDTLWRTSRFSRKSYASPAIVSIGGTPQIVCSSDGSIDGYELSTGRQLWTFEEIGANTQNTPLPIGKDRVLIGASPGMNDVRMDDARDSNLCLRIRKTQEGYTPEVLWRAEKALSHFASPIAHRGLAYWVTKAGIVHCYDDQTGQLIYRKRAGEQCYATPVAVEDRIYLFGKGGTTTVIASGADFQILSVNELWDIRSIPASNPDSFVRGSGNRHNNGNGRPRGIPSRDGERKPGGPLTNEERDAARSRGENRFADPIQYGVAFSGDSIVIRTGEQVHCIRKGGAR